MKYRGVEYTIIQGTQPDVWKWRVMVGRPEMLRMGEATDQMHAELQVRHVIDPRAVGKIRLNEQATVSVSRPCRTGQRLLTHGRSCAAGAL